MSTPSDTPENSSRAPEIRPALSAEEWEWAKKYPELRKDTAEDLARSGNLPGAAAFCLHDHPAGFGWEDVELLRQVAEMARSWDEAIGDPDVFDNLADRIESLLPPKEE